MAGAGEPSERPGAVEEGGDRTDQDGRGREQAHEEGHDGHRGNDAEGAVPDYWVPHEEEYVAPIDGGLGRDGLGGRQVCCARIGLSAHPAPFTTAAPRAHKRLLWTRDQTGPPPGPGHPPPP